MKSIKQKKRQLPENLKIEIIQKCEVDISKLVELFFQNLTAGSNFRHLASNLKQIRTKSITEDDVFVATGGLKKPSSHLMLGREINKKLFKILVSYLKEIIFAKKQVLLLTDINAFYLDLLTEFRVEDLDTVGLTAQKLEEILLKIYGDKI